MQNVVNSKEKLLNGPEIIAMSATETAPNEDRTVLLGAIAAETTRPSADLVQIGNTVFLGHRGKGKNKRKMVGRAFNVDTGRNFIVNGFKYFTYLQKNGITHYTTEFDTPVYLNAFKIFKRRADQLDTNIAIGQYNTGGYVVFIELGKKPLTRGL